jgi:hypothetical protein
MPVCKKCGNEFPNRVVIEEKTRNLCNRSYCLECAPFGEGRRVLVIPDNDRVCIHCGKKLEGFKKKYCSKECFRDHDTRRYMKRLQRIHRNKQKLVDLKGGKCHLCGYDKFIGSLEFHHRDASDKEFRLSLARVKRLEDVYLEAEKCDLVCANCHREIHLKHHYQENGRSNTSSS